jgi:hypothetical protein
MHTQLGLISCIYFLDVLKVLWIRFAIFLVGWQYWSLLFQSSCNIRGCMLQHNFTDGMALGSAFLLHGTVGGWSRTLFLLAHELPQEVCSYFIRYLLSCIS